MKTRRRSKRKASPAQIAARKKFAAKYGGKKAKSSSPRRVAKKARRKVRRVSSILAKEGRHRPVVIVRKRKLVRPRRSSIPARATFKNPFLGELAMIGNPRKRRKSRSKSHRRSGRRRSRGMALFANPGGKALSSILAGPREMATMDFAKDAASVAAGFVLPNMIVAKLPANLRDSRMKVYGSKIAVVAGLSAAASVVSKRAAKMVLLGGGVSLLLDAWVDWIAPALGQGGAAPAPGGTGVYYGDEPGVGVYYGLDGASSLAETFA